MSLAKKLGKSERLRGFLCWIGSLYIRLVGLTTRWQVQNSAIPASHWDQQKPFILSFWHGRLLMMPKCWNPKKPIQMLISQHRDGQLIARTVAHFGIQTVAGSSTRGGAQALRGMLKALKAGEYVGITPDGPKGPRMRASGGVVAVAKLSGAPVIPATYAVQKRKILGSWDRFIVALPFSRGVILWGEPISIPKDMDDEAARLLIETAMNELSAKADQMMGHAPIEPAPLLISSPAEG